MKPLDFAVVGLAHGSNHVLSLMRNPQARVTAVCDLDPRSFAALAAKIEAEKLTPPPYATVTSYDELLKRDGIEAVVLAVPTGCHAAMTLQALSAGKHVLLEKPLALNLAEADQICRAAAQSDRTLAVAYCVRSSHLQHRCLETIARGAIGEVVLVWYHQFCEEHPVAWRGHRTAGGGKLFDCACHYFDLMGQWAGAPPERVAAFGNAPGRKGPNRDELPQVASIIVEYANGVKGTYSLSSVTPGDNQACFGVVGTRGRIEGDPWLPEQAGSLLVYAEDNRCRERIEMNGARNSRGHLGFDEQHDHFIAAVREGRPVQCSAAEARETLRLMLAIDRAIATGQVVEVAAVR